MSTVSKLAGTPFPPALRSNRYCVDMPVVQFPLDTPPSLALQTSTKEMLLRQKSATTFSRREMMHSSAASLTGIGIAIALSFAEPSEARVQKPEVRRKILEKLERERAKAKEKAGNSDSTTP